MPHPGCCGRESRIQPYESDTFHMSNDRTNVQGVDACALGDTAMRMPYRVDPDVIKHQKQPCMNHGVAEKMIPLRFRIQGLSSMPVLHRGKFGSQYMSLVAFLRPEEDFAIIEEHVKRAGC